MSNIELYQSALTSSFPELVAAEILGHIEGIFGPEQFAKTYGHLSNQEALQLVCKVLNGLTPLNLKRGIERLLTATWCPRITEFRSWCEVGGDWWTADQAWAKTLNFLDDQTKPITKLAKCVLDEVQIILKGEGLAKISF